jgi:hypothetical protein
MVLYLAFHIQSNLGEPFVRSKSCFGAKSEALSGGCRPTAGEGIKEKSPMGKYPGDAIKSKLSRKAN